MKAAPTVLPSVERSRAAAQRASFSMPANHQRAMVPAMHHLQQLAYNSPAATQLRRRAALMSGSPIQRKISVAEGEVEYANSSEAYAALHANFSTIPEGGLRNILRKFSKQNVVFATYGDLERAVDAAATDELYAKEDLWIKSGGLEDLQGDMGDQYDLWPGLSKHLLASCGRHAAEVKSANGLLDCGKLTIPVDLNVSKENLSGGAPSSKTLLRVAECLMSFMKANGQLDYIQAQDWFLDGSYKVVVEMNFYPERSFDENYSYLGVHKDTDARNLFVNLIFNNKTAMPNTEWTMDELAPDEMRKGDLKKYLPRGAIQSINGAKQQMQGLPQNTPGRSNWEGGTVKRYGYVSWVDELIWHSTPAMKARPRFVKENVLKWVREGTDPGNLAYYEAMLIVAKNTHGHIGAKLNWLKRALFDMETWGVKGAKMKLGNTDWKTLRRQVVAEINAIQWGQHKVTGAVGSVEVNKGQGVLTDSRGVPTGVGERPRSNSDPTVMKKNLAALKKMREQAKGELPKRSFIRSWVTLVKS